MSVEGFSIAMGAVLKLKALRPMKGEFLYFLMAAARALSRSVVLRADCCFSLPWSLPLTWRERGYRARVSSLRAWWPYAISLDTDGCSASFCLLL